MAVYFIYIEAGQLPIVEDYPVGNAKRSAKPKQVSTGRKPVAPGRTMAAAGAATTQKSVGTDGPMDRRSGRDRRRTTDRRKRDEPVAVERRTLQRRAKVNRRRQIDPTTCERDYTPDEIEFMNALDDYKRLSGRMFPTCSEVLEVVKKLGYGKRPVTEAADEAALGLGSEPPVGHAS